MICTVKLVNSFVEKLSMLVWAEKSFLENENMQGKKRRTFKMLKLIRNAATILLDHCKTHKEKLKNKESQHDGQRKKQRASLLVGFQQQQKHKKETLTSVQISLTVRFLSFYGI